MTKHDIKRLPVVSEAGALLGVVSRVDILRQMLAVESERPSLAIPAGAALTVRQVMYSSVPSVPPEADLAEIVATMLQAGLRRLIVVDLLGRPRGLIGDADIVSRIQPPQRRGVLAALRGGPAPASQVKAEDLMSSGVLTAGPDTPVVEAARQMLSLRRKWLVVVDEQMKTIGLVDRQILLRAVTGS